MNCLPFGTSDHVERRDLTDQVERAMTAGVPFAWVAADSVYGVGELEGVLRRAGKGYVLGVTSIHPFRSWGINPPVAGTAEQIAQELEATAWQRLSAGEGTKGARLYDWAYCPLADLDAAEYDDTGTGRWTRGLLVRRTIADGDLAYFSTWCPAGTDIATLVRIEGHRWAIEDSFETAKNELGLDHNETRSWHGWHRHVSLVMLAFAMMTVIRHKANGLTAPPKKAPGASPNQPCLIRWSVQEIRRVANRLTHRHIHPAHVIAWSSCRRAHQATTQQAHCRRQQQL
jgi:SRSO17 transposase